jgi:hypothetical protein
MHGREQDRGSWSTRKHTAAAQTHTACEFARMWLTAGALVALAAQECSGLQVSGHMVVLRVKESFGIGVQKNMPQVQKWLQRRHSEKE